MAASRSAARSRPTRPKRSVRVADVDRALKHIELEQKKADVALTRANADAARASTKRDGNNQHVAPDGTVKPGLGLDPLRTLASLVERFEKIQTTVRDEIHRAAVEHRLEAEHPSCGVERPYGIDEEPSITTKRVTGTAAAYAPRIDRGPAQPSHAPRSTGIIEGATDRVHLLIERVECGRNLVNARADQVLGGIPQAGDKGTGTNGPPDGQANQLHTKIGALEHVVALLLEAIDRLGAL